MLPPMEPVHIRYELTYPEYRGMYMRAALRQPAQVLMRAALFLGAAGATWMAWYTGGTLVWIYAAITGWLMLAANFFALLRHCRESSRKHVFLLQEMSWTFDERGATNRLINGDENRRNWDEVTAVGADRRFLTFRYDDGKRAVIPVRSFEPPDWEQLGDWVRDQTTHRLPAYPG